MEFVSAGVWEGALFLIKLPQSIRALGLFSWDYAILLKFSLEVLGLIIKYANYDGMTGG